MKGVIRFTNLRLPMAVLSALLIVGGAVGTMLRGGVNLSVDLSGGVSQQFQIAPVALHISDVGAALEPELTPPDPLLGRPGFLTVQWLQDGTLRRRVLDFEAYPTIGAIAEVLATIAGVEVELAAPADTPAEQLQPPGFREAGETLVLGYLAPAAGGSASISAVRTALAPLERFSLQATGGPDEQRYIVNVQFNQDYMAWITQGPVARRDLEKLGESDKGIILFRKLLDDQIRLMEDGGDPMNVFRQPMAPIRLPIEPSRGFAQNPPKKYVPQEAGASNGVADVERVYATYRQ